MEIDVIYAVPWLPLAIAGAGLLQGVVSSFGQSSANKTNVQLSKEAREWDLEMWNRQNQYNLPANQIKRLRDAGLNPNLAYGSGSVAGNVTSSAPRSNVPRVENTMNNLNILNSAVSALSAYNDTVVKQNSAKLIEEKIKTEQLNQRKTNEYADYMGWKKMSEAYNSGIMEHNLRFKEQFLKAQLDGQLLTNLLRKNQSEMQPIQAEKLVWEKGSAEQNYKMKQLELEMQSSLKQYNMTANDTIWARLLAKIFSNIKF